MHTSEDFKLLAQQTQNARLKLRYLALYHFKNGKNRTQIASYLGVARGSVNTWVSNYLAYGIKGLQSKPHPGRAASLSLKQQQQVAQFIHLNAVKPDGGRLIGEDIRQYILDNFQVSYTLRNVYKLIHSLGFSWITSRSKHPKQSPEVQETFKKVPSGNDPSHPI